MMTNIKGTALVCLLMAGALGGAATTNAIDRDEYAASVLDILRTHLGLLEELAVTDRFKYSDNLVRHALAVQDTFGLLGPMEWHAAEAVKLHNKHNGNSTDLNAEMFEDLASASRKSLKDLVRAAHDSLEKYDGTGVVSAINTVKESCTNCHRLLPKSVAPDLWGPLERQ